MDKAQSAMKQAVASEEAQSLKLRKIGFWTGIALFVIMLAIPTPSGLKPQAWRTAAVGVWMGVWWITEAVGLGTTSIIPIAAFPAMSILSAKDTLTPYADDLVFIFFGGFLIAGAMQKWNLHRRIALNIIKVIGASPSRVLLGVMLATAFVSMWISNTSTTAMMMPIALAIYSNAVSILRETGAADEKSEGMLRRFGLGLMLGTAWAATIGGSATLVGCTPNPIMAGTLAKMFPDHPPIDFVRMLIMGGPPTVVLLILTWIVLSKMILPRELKELPGGGREIIREELAKLGPMKKGELYTLLVFIACAAAWVVSPYWLSKVTMLKDGTIGMAAGLLLFLIPTDINKMEFVLDWKTASKIPWDILLLFGGGLSLANAIDKTGLAAYIGNSLLVLQHVPPLVMVIAIYVLVAALTQFTSNTATAAMMMPIMGSLAIGMGVDPVVTMIPAAFGAAYAFMTPVGTPPNAIVMGSGLVRVPDMFKYGLIIQILGLLTSLLAIYGISYPLFGIH